MRPFPTMAPASLRLFTSVVYDPAKWILFFKQVLYTLTFGFLCFAVATLECLTLLPQIFSYQNPIYP